MFMMLQYSQLLVVIFVVIRVTMQQSTQSTAPPHCFVSSGSTCAYSCHCAGGVPCDRRSGGCPSGCAAEWSGDACQIGNVALGKTAYQTSHLALNGLNLAGNCVDGDDNIDTSRNSCCAITGGDVEGAEYWEVDLGGVYVVERVVITASNQYNGGSSTRNSYLRFYLENQFMHEQSTTRLSDTRKDISLPSLTKTDRVRMQKRHESMAYPIAMCEVSVIGYPYVECEPHEGNYYYGPACVHDCGCEVAEQCDYITGDVSCSSCKTGYSIRGGKCDTCSSGRWGSRCMSDCNCFDVSEICHHVNGSCLISGCAQWYAGTGCDHELPRLGAAVVPVVTADGRTITVHLELTESNRRRRAVATSYTVGYRMITADDNSDGSDDLIYIQPTWQQRQSRVMIGTVMMPSIRQNYSICVVPYDSYGLGELSACVAVWTQCVDGQYGGTDCHYQCTCRDKDEVCDKTTGRCEECDDDRVGVDCKLAVPGNSDVLVNYVPGVTEIQINIETDTRNVKYYQVVCTSDININNHTEVLQVGLKNTVSGILSNLQSSTDYTCHIVPVLVDAYDEYTGKALHRKTVTTMVEAVNHSSTVPIVVGVMVTFAVLAAIAGAIVFILFTRGRSNKDGSATLKIMGKRNAEEVSYVNGNVKTAGDQMYENVGAQVGDVEQADDSDVYQIPQNHTVMHKTIPDKELKPALPSRKPALPPATPPATTIAESHLPIKLKDFAQHMVKMKSPDCNLDIEFSKIPESSAPCKAGEKTRNTEKHRFLNIKAYDHSRVKLDVSDSEDPESDYINACYIRDYHGNRTVIASQAPRVPTIDDTWRMIWQEDVNQIVMLTRLKEGDKVKCQRYWPVEGEQEYAGLTVELLSSTSNSFYIERRMRVTKGQDTRMVTQLQYTNWPDHGVPESAHEVLYLYYKVKSMEQTRTGPLLVHCSAGVGRTGTFIGLEWLLEQSVVERRVDVVKCVRSMREDRTQMVQNVHQYRFLYQLLHEALTIGNTTITNDNYKSYTSTSGHVTVISNQLAQINQFYQPAVCAADCSDALRPENMDKTRGGTDNAPANIRRLFLHTPVPNGNDYINAVSCSSFNQNHDLIITQLPLHHTVPDMWRLVYDHAASGIVLLDDIPSDEQPYWPEDAATELTIGPLSVKLAKVSGQTYDGVTVRDFTIKHKTNDSRTVRQWHLTTWGQSHASVSPNVLRVLVDLSTQHANKTAASGATIVQCMDGVTKSGLYVAYNNLLEMMAATKTIDVCFVARQVRCARPQAIRSVEQLHLLYKWMDDALSNTREYYN